MTGSLQPLDYKYPIVDQFGRPTPAFIRWAQQRQEDIEASAEESSIPGIVNSAIQDFTAAHPLSAGQGITILPPSGDLADDLTISAGVQDVLDQLGTSPGSIIYRGASDWAVLGPGSPGYVLQTNGAAPPSWVPQSGGGGGSDPSWSFGSGDRRAVVQATATGNFNGTPQNSLSSTGTNSFIWTAGALQKSVILTFPKPNRLQGYMVVQNGPAVNGVWTVEGSNDGIAWTTIITDMVIGGTPYGPSGFTPPNNIYAREWVNPVAYLQYRILHNTGTTISTSNFMTYIGFKCDPI